MYVSFLEEISILAYKLFDENFIYVILQNKFFSLFLSLSILNH